MLFSFAKSFGTKERNRREIKIEATGPLRLKKVAQKKGMGGGGARIENK